MLAWLWRPCASRVSRACGLVAGWFQLDRQKQEDPTIELQDAVTRFVIIHPAGAMMRNGPGIRSAEVGMLHRGEVVTVLKDSGRRACIRTREGIRAWISTATAEDVPTVRRVTAGMKVEEVPAGGASQKSNAAFADEFEHRWQEKWQRIRVNADDSHEGKPLSVRQGAPGMQINAWRPSGAPKESLRESLRKRRGDDPEKVPRLESPPPPSTEIAVPNSARSPTKRGVAAGEDLLDLEDTFETWPRAVARAATSGGRQGVPSLVELFSTEHQATSQVQGRWAKQEKETPASGVADVASPMTGDDTLQAESDIVIAGQGGADGIADGAGAGASRFSDLPPSRGYSTEVAAVEDMVTADKFDYLLKDFPEILMRQVEQDVEESSPQKHGTETGGGLATAAAGFDYDTHADFSGSDDDDAVEEVAPAAILGESSSVSVVASATTSAAGTQEPVPTSVTESPEAAAVTYNSEEALRVLMQTYSSPAKDSQPSALANTVESSAVAEKAQNSEKALRVLNADSRLLSASDATAPLSTNAVEETPTRQGSEDVAEG